MMFFGRKSGDGSIAGKPDIPKEGNIAGKPEPWNSENGRDVEDLSPKTLKVNGTTCAAQGHIHFTASRTTTTATDTSSASGADSSKSSVGPLLPPPKKSAHAHRSQASEDEGKLILPSTEAVMKQVTDGGSSVTFLQVALNIVSRVEKDVDSLQYGDELRFVKACLTAGLPKTQIVCQLLNEEAPDKEVRESLCETYARRTSCASNQPKLPQMQRKGFEMRGALSAARTQQAAQQSETPSDPPMSESPSSKQLTQLNKAGLPWMGPPVPIWPVRDMPQSMGGKLQQLFDEQFNTWDFDIFELHRITHSLPLLYGGWEAFVRCGCFSQFNIKSDKVSCFLQQAERMYRPEEATPYHNNVHAADVVQTIHALSFDIGFGRFLDPMDSFVLVLGAIIHDLGHDGRNNAYHVGVQDELAITYNDRSVLENYHLSLAFKLLVSNKETNMLQGLCSEQQKIVRSEVIDMVLGTDMSQHFARVGDFSRLADQLRDDVEAWHADEANMAILRTMLLHSSDISNPTKRFKMATQWSFRCLREFFLQGDAEKKAGVPVSPLCDRVTTDIPGSQIGFIQFIVQPAFEELSILRPKEVSEICLVQSAGNMKAWEHRSRNRELYEDTRDLKTYYVSNGTIKNGDGSNGDSGGEEGLASVEEAPQTDAIDEILEQVHQDIANEEKDTVVNLSDPQIEESRDVFPVMRRTPGPGGIFTGMWCFTNCK